MKPVVIIAIAVGCSVLVVLGILFALESYRVSEAQKAYNIELERQAVCDRLYDNMGDLEEIELWGICLNYGIYQAVDNEVSNCGRGINHSTEICRIDTKILAMKVVDQEITLDTKFKKSFTSNLNNLQESRNTLVEQRQIEEQENQLKFSEMANIETQWKSKYLFTNPTNWYPIYQKCIESEIMYYETDFMHKQFCDNTLKSAIDSVCNQDFRYVCGLKFTDVLSNNVDNSKLVFNTEAEKYNKIAESCSSQGDGTYLRMDQVKGCVCKEKIDYYGWHELCSKGKIIPQVTPSETISEGTQSLSEIENEYSECKMNETYGTKCKEQLKEKMDLYCRITTDSHEDYDECFGQITEIQ